MSTFLRDAEAQLEIARAQFQPISHEERERLDEITDMLAGPENEIVCKSLGPNLFCLGAELVARYFGEARLSWLVPKNGLQYWRHELP